MIRQANLLIEYYPTPKGYTWKTMSSGKHILVDKNGNPHPKSAKYLDGKDDEDDDEKDDEKSDKGGDLDVTGGLGDVAMDVIDKSGVEKSITG